MVDCYQIESEQSLYCLYSVATEASFAVDVISIDSNSVDVMFSARGKLHSSSLKLSPGSKVSSRLAPQNLHTLYRHTKIGQFPKIISGEIQFGEALYIDGTIDRPHSCLEADRKRGKKAFNTW